MGQATRTTKLLLDLGARAQGGAKTGKRTYLEATAALLNEARSSYLDFFLAHVEKLSERPLSAHELLAWSEFHTIATNEHLDPSLSWNFSERFPDMPCLYRRSVFKDAIAKVKAYLANHTNWKRTSKKKGKPGMSGAHNHYSLYKWPCSLELDQPDVRESFVRLKVYTSKGWRWASYPVKYSHYFEQWRTDPMWLQQSPKLVLHPRSAELHFRQTREVEAKTVKESKLDPDLVTIEVDLNVKNARVWSGENKKKLDTQAERLISWYNATSTGLWARWSKSVAAALMINVPTFWRGFPILRSVRLGFGTRTWPPSESLTSKRSWRCKDENWWWSTPLIPPKTRLLGDFVAIITSLTARLYGPRRAKRKTEQILAALEQEGS
jgi:putative resolvase